MRNDLGDKLPITAIACVALLALAVVQAAIAGATPAPNEVHAEPNKKPDSSALKSAAIPMTTGARSERWSVLTGSEDLLAQPDFLSQYQVVVLGRDTEPFLSDAAVAGGSVTVTGCGPLAVSIALVAVLLLIYWFVR